MKILTQEWKLLGLIKIGERQTNQKLQIISAKVIIKIADREEERGRETGGGGRKGEGKGE